VNGCEKPPVSHLCRVANPVITEISYYFNWRGRDGELEWMEGSTHAEDVVLEDFLARLTSFRNKS
jgi:hypothetical protein